MTKVRILGRNQAQKSITRQINDAISRNEIYKDSADLLKEEIRSGKNPKTGRNYRRLTNSTITNRRYLARYNPTHPDYSARKSNLTLTGQLVESIKSRFVKSSGELSLTITGTHKRYRGKNGLIGKSQSNASISRNLEKQGRPLLVLSNKFIEKIVKRIEAQLRRL